MENGKRGTANGKRQTGNGKRETGSESRGTGNRKLATKQRTGNDNTDRAVVPTSFPGFSTTRPYGLSTGGRENLGTKLLGFKLGFVPVFHFPVSRFSNIPKKSYLHVQYVFPPLLRTYLVKENYDNHDVFIRHFRDRARF